jgi:hypothetical protein
MGEQPNHTDFFGRTVTEANAAVPHLLPMTFRGSGQYWTLAPQEVVDMAYRLQELGANHNIYITNIDIDIGHQQ